MQRHQENINGARTMALPLEPDFLKLPPSMEKGLGNIVNGLRRIDDAIFDSSVHLYQATLGANSAIHNLVGEAVYGIALTIPHVDMGKATPIVLTVLTTGLGLIGCTPAVGPADITALNLQEAIKKSAGVQVLPNCRVSLPSDTIFRKTPKVRNEDTGGYESNAAGSVPAGKVFIVENPFSVFGPRPTSYSGKNPHDVRYYAFFKNDQLVFVLDDSELIEGMLESTDCEKGSTTVNVVANVMGTYYYVDDQGVIRPMGVMQEMDQKEFKPLMLEELGKIKKP